MFFFVAFFLRLENGLTVKMGFIGVTQRTKEEIEIFTPKELMGYSTLEITR